MATNLTPLTPTPPPAEPIADPKTGLMTRNWYQYFKRLDDHIRDVERRITDLEP